MDYSRFYEEYKELPGMKAFSTILEDTFTGDVKEYYDLDAIKALYRGKKEALSKSQFHNRKKIIVALYEWLKYNNVVNEVIVDTVKGMSYGDIINYRDLQREYFGSLDEVIRYISRVGKSFDLGNYDDLLNLKTIAILAWHNVGTSEMTYIKKHDVHIDLGYVKVGENRVYIDERFLKVIDYFASLNTHRGFPSCKTQYYKDSNYLMRSSASDKMEVNHIERAISRFNAESKKKGKVITLANLRTNGVMRRVYDEAILTGGNEETLLRNHLGCDASFVNRFKKLYKAWKDTIIGGEAE